MLPSRSMYIIKDLPIEMPVDVTVVPRASDRHMPRRIIERINSPVKEPRSGVVGDETNGYIVTGTSANGHHIAPNRVVVIVHRAVCRPHNTECMLTNRFS